MRGADRRAEAADRWRGRDRLFFTWRERNASRAGLPLFAWRRRDDPTEFEAKTRPREIVTIEHLRASGYLTKLKRRSSSTTRRTASAVHANRGPSLRASVMFDTTMRLTKGEGMAKTNGLDVARLRQLARVGAEVTLNRLRAEIMAIERTFPELATPTRRRQVVQRAAKQASTRTRRMSAAARKAVSERMKRYWAERRKVTAKVAK